MEAAGGGSSTNRCHPHPPPYSKSRSSSSSPISSMRSTEAHPSYESRAVAAMEAANRMPILKSAFVEEREDDSSEVSVSSVWSQDSPATGKRVALAKKHLWDSETGVLMTRGKPEQLSSSATMRETSGDLTLNFVKEDGFDLLYVTKGNILWKSFNLSSLDLHGPVYFDSDLGGAAVSADLATVAYIAEKKTEKAAPFFQTKDKKQKDEFGSKEEERPSASRLGGAFSRKDDFGEEMAGKSEPCVVLLHLLKERFEVLDSERVFGAEGFCPGQLVFRGSSELVGIALIAGPYRLGLFLCSNRPGIVFKLDLNSKTVQVLSKEEGVSCTSPRISRDGSTLIWLESLPFKSTCKLMKLTLSEEGAEPEVRVSEEPDQGKIRYCSSRGSDPSPGHSFGGIFQPSLPKRCFSSNGDLIFSNVLVDTLFPVIASAASGRVSILKDWPGVSVLDVSGDVVAASQSSKIWPHSLLVGQFSEDNISFSSCVKDAAKKMEDFECETIFVKPEKEHPDPRYRDVNFSCVYSGPKAGKEKSVPVILWAHGGPHILVSTDFGTQPHFFNLMGYGMVFPNYRGSLGVGKRGVECLPGHIGELDVADCRQALHEALLKYPHLDPDRVFLYGGSHGGFLVLHLAARYPGVFRGVVARNPVTNYATMATATDIPDCVWLQQGRDFTYDTPDASSLTQMYKISPIRHAHLVTVPVYLMLSSGDRRVPHSQGLEFYRKMRALGRSAEKVRVNLYNDCHMLEDVSVNADVMANCALFFHEILAGAIVC